MNGTEICSDCGAGKYSDAPSLTSCKDCEAGEYQPIAGKSACFPCIPGKFNDELGQLKCKVCSKNTNSESSTATECNICRLGKTSEPGSARCQACGAGTYGKGCKPCELGYARSSTDTDTTQCKICGLGETTSSIGAASCEKCDVGQYGSATGTCSICPSDKFQDGKGEIDCKVCKNGEVPNDQRTGCKLPPWGECKIGEYLNDLSLEKNDWSCLTCPDGAECTTLPVPTLSILQNQPGFWRVPNIYYDQPTKPRVEYILCNFPDRCSSTYNFSLSCQKLGTEGPMCAVCSDHFNLDSNGICTECSDSVLATRMMLCVMVFVLLILCFLFIQRKVARLSRKYKDMKKDIFRLVIIFINFAQIGSSMPSVFKIRWPPTYLELINRLDNIFNLNILQLSGVPCATKIDYGSRMVFMAMLPLLVLLVVVLIDCCLRSRRRNLKSIAGSDHHRKFFQSSLMRVFEMVDHDGSDSLDANEMMQLFQHVGKQMKKNDVRKLICQWENNSNAKELSRELSRDVFTTKMAMVGKKKSTFLTKQQELNVLEWAESSAAGFTRTISFIGEIMFVIHSPVSKVAFQWHSLQLVGDRHFLKADPSIQHGTEEWSRKLWLSLFILLFFTFGFPLILILLLAKYRKTLWKIETKSRIGWMYDRYNFGTEWWGLHECFRKLILTGMLIFIEQLETRIVCASIVSLFAMVNLSYNRPLRNKTVFWVSEIALSMTSIRYIMASYLIIKQEKGYIPKAGDNSDMVLVVLEVATWCMFLCGIILCIVMGMKTTGKGKRKEKVRTDSTAVVAENGEEEEVEAEAENDVFASFEEEQRSGDLHRRRPSFLNHTSVQRAVRNHNTAVEVQAVQENASAHILKKRQSIDQANKEARRRLQARLQAHSISAGKKKGRTKRTKRTGGGGGGGGGGEVIVLPVAVAGADHMKQRMQKFAKMRARMQNRMAKVRNDRGESLEDAETLVGGQRLEKEEKTKTRTKEMVEDDDDISFFADD